jgi:pilus assembly protein CpaE
MNAPFNPRGSLRDPFSAFLSDLDTEDVARATALSFGWPLERINNGGIHYAVQSLAVSPSPAVLLIDLSTSTEPLDDINALAEVCEPGTIVLACGTTNDVQLYRALIANGITDYLLKPLTQEQLHQAIVNAQTAQSGARGGEADAEQPHLMAAVIGVRGGVGASTVATSLAWLVSEQDRATALLDLDMQFGTAALGLDLEPGRGLTDAIENPSRIDGLFLERALVQASPRLGVLSAEAPITQPMSGDGAAFFHLQDELRGAVACTVIDLPRHVMVQHPGLLRDVGVAVVVADLTLAATRDTIRILSWLRANAPATRTILVANKVPPTGQEEVARKEFEASVERAIDVALPLDAKLATQAARLGKPLAETARGSKPGQALAEIATLLLSEEGEAPASIDSLLDRLAKRAADFLRKPGK